MTQPTKPQHKERKTKWYTIIQPIHKLTNTRCESPGQVRGRRQRRQPLNPPAPLRGTSVLNSDQDRFFQIPEPPPLPPALPPTPVSSPVLPYFADLFFNQNLHSNFAPNLIRFCLQLGLQNPPKIHAKSISRVALKFDAILVGFFSIFLRFPSLGEPQNLAKTLSVVRNHTFTIFASKLLGKRLGIDFGFHFGLILVPFWPPRVLRKTTKNITIFCFIFLPPSWANLGTSGVHFCASSAKPARHGSRKAPRPPKTPSRPRFSRFFNDFRHDFLAHFWTRCLQNVLDHFSNKYAMQPVSENSPPRFFPACVQELSHNTSKIR